MTLLLQLFITVAVSWILYHFAYGTDKPKMKGLPEAFGLPFLHSLPGLGESHARKAAEWSKKYGPVFQARLGNRVSGISSFKY